MQHYRNPIDLRATGIAMGKGGACSPRTAGCLFETESSLPVIAIIMKTGSIIYAASFLKAE